MAELPQGFLKDQEIVELKSLFLGGTELMMIEAL